MTRRGTWIPAAVAAWGIALFALPLAGERGGLPPTRSVTLRWTLPGDPDCAGVMLRYSTEGHPAGPEEGRPVPNGREGRFPGGPGEEGRFVHDGLSAEQGYYYAAFAYDDVPLYAPPARLLLPPAPPSEESDGPPVDPLYLEVGGGRPNPFNGSVLFPFEIRDRRAVRGDVYDSVGRHVATFMDRVCPPGGHRAVWDGRDGRGRPAPGGVYFAVIDTGTRRETRKAVLLR